MLTGRISNATHELGKPEAWDNEKGHCGSLAVRLEREGGESNIVRAMLIEISPQGLQMTSAWFPNADEIARIVAGAPIHLTIVGAVHPPVSLNVGEAPT